MISTRCRNALNSRRRVNSPRLFLRLAFVDLHSLYHCCFKAIKVPLGYRVNQKLLENKVALQRHMALGFHLLCEWGLSVKIKIYARHFATRVHFRKGSIMAIDLSEKLYSFTKIAKKLPKRRGGKRVHVSTIFRWASKNGCKGVRLEFVQVGSTKCTLCEALRRFFDALRSKEEQAQSDKTEQPRATYNQRRRDIEKANRSLEAEGL